VPDQVALAGIVYVLRKGVAWRDVPVQVVGCSGITSWRRLRDWTEAGVWPALHHALLTELRAADALDIDDCAVDCSHVRALKDISGGYEVKPPARLGVTGAVRRRAIRQTAVEP
jgi:transposase